MLYGILLLFGVGLMVTALDSSDDSSGVDDPETNDQPILEDGTLTGTDGNDMLDLAGIQDLSRVDGGSGDDTVILENEDYLINNIDIQGGDGDDHIDASYIPAAEVYGGAGDDTISVTNHVYDQYAFAYGGDGDDTINMDTNALGTIFPDGGVSAEGGAGSDSFNIDIAYGHMEIPEDSVEGNGQNVATISDFNAEEGTLVINLRTEDPYNGGPLEEGNSYTGLRIEDGGTADAPTASVILNFVNENGGTMDLVVALGGGPFPDASNITVNF